MKKALKIITILNLVILLYWIPAKFLNIYDTKLLGIVYEMTILIVAGLTFLLPVSIIVMVIINRKNLTIKELIYSGLLFLFSLITIFIMTRDPLKF